MLRSYCFVIFVNDIFSSSCWPADPVGARQPARLVWQTSSRILDGRFSEYQKLQRFWCLGEYLSVTWTKSRWEPFNSPFFFKENNDEAEYVCAGKITQTFLIKLFSYFISRNKGPGIRFEGCPYNLKNCPRIFHCFSCILSLYTYIGEVTCFLKTRGPTRGSVWPPA